MRKWLLALVAALAATGANAHIVSPIPFSDIAGLDDVVKVRRLQGVAPSGVQQIFRNIVTDEGAQCSGVQEVSKVVTINSGTNSLTVTSDTFVNAAAPAGDIGKYVNIPDAGPSDGSGGFYPLLTTITAVGAWNGTTQTITVQANASNTLTAATKKITWGVDDAWAFRNFNTWARANQGTSPVKQVVLTVPNGAVCYFASNGGFIPGTTLFNAWAAGIRNLIVSGAGARLTGMGGAGFSLGGQGQIQQGLTAAGGKSARIQTVSAGSTQVALTPASYSAGYISRFAVGNIIMFSGIDLQGQWQFPRGYPSNPQFFEWRRITAICNNTGPCVGGATITIDQPLTYAYLDTWPEYNSGNNFEVDNGGPGTIYFINDTWDMSAEYRGAPGNPLQIDQDGQTYAGARNITYRDAQFGGIHGAIPTQNDTWTAINVSMPLVFMEIDKLVGLVTLNNFTVTQVNIQSASVDTIIGSGVTVTGGWFGSAKNNAFTDSTFNNWTPGVTTHGIVTGYTTCTRCLVTTFGYNGGIFQNDDPPYSMSSGVISFPNNTVLGGGPPSRVWVPGGNVYWSGSGYLTTGLFQSGALTQDATNVYVQTSEAGTFPTITAKPQFRTHPAPKYTCDDPNPASDPVFIAGCLQAGATALKPLGEWARRSYAPTSAQGDIGLLQAKGKLVDYTIDVTQAYNGSGTAILNATARFNNTGTVKQSDWTNFTWGPVVNLKQVGKRVISPGGVTCDTGGGPVAGGCAGDTINAGLGYPPEAVWIQSQITPWMGSTLGAGTQPQFTLTLRTNQGVVP